LRFLNKGAFRKGFWMRVFGGTKTAKVSSYLENLGASDQSVKVF